MNCFMLLDSVSPDVQLEKQLSNLEVLLADIKDWAISFSVKLVLALIVFLIGYWLIKIILKIFLKAMNRSKADTSVTTFLHSVINVSLKLFLFIAVIGTLGFDVSTIIAALGAAAVTIGLAIKDSLANVASGTLIILFKKFKTGDFIETEGIIGEVLKVDMMYTTLRTYDHKEVLIPNSRLTNNNVINHFSLDARRLEILVPISYAEDIEKARKVILYEAMKSEYVLHDRNNRVEVDKFNQSSVDLWVWIWVRSENYWDALFDLRQRIKKALDEADITIPFNQMDIHLDVNDSLRKFESVMEDRKGETRQ